MNTSSLDAVFRPRSVAVVGASRNPASLGHAVLRNLVQGGFTGVVYPVNPKARAVLAFRCYPSLGAIPDPVDLAIVVVPRDLVAPTIDDGLAKGVGGFVVITAGFGETGPEGRRLEEELAAKVQAAGARMIGPNCMGVLNTDPEIRLDASFAPTSARRGSLGFISQSGALGVAILNAADALGLGLTQFVSVGNKADVSGNDLLEYWENDPATRVIAMYLESFGNPRHFTELAKRVGRRKPILMLKSGRTVEGARAASSHTGALAGADVTVSTFLEHCGVRRVGSIEELFNTVRVFDRCPPPAGSRVAIVTNAGGPGIMATDACVEAGLIMARLGEATTAALAAFLPPEASLVNPVDMIASAVASSYERAVSAVLADPAVDMVIAIHVMPRPAYPIEELESIAAAGRAAPGKPLVTVMMATEDFYHSIQERDDLPPVYRFPEAAVQALHHLCCYAEWRRRPIEEERVIFETDDARVERILARTADGYLPPADVFEVLQVYGVPTAVWRTVESAAAAGEAAAEILKTGGAVVLKAVAADVVHKSDLGGVAVGLEDVAEVVSAGEEMARRLGEAGHRVEGFLVQEMATSGHEVAFGVSMDSRFGPLLMFGLGGRYIEVFQDVRFGVTPLSAADADDMIRGIRGAKLLAGTRGERAADHEILREVLLRLAQLAERHPRIVELDINPFMASPERASAKAVDGRIRLCE